MTHWTDKLQTIEACKEAISWGKDYPDLETAWAACERGDWMAWLVGRVNGGKVGSPERKKLLMALCDIARLELPYAHRPVPQQTIETVEAYCKGEATLEDVHAFAAAYAFAAAFAAAAGLAAYATSAATYAATYAATLRQIADIMRQHYPTPPEIEAVP